jgi:hypothetical protein
MLRELPIPEWIFNHPGSYYMIGIEPCGRVRVDGAHSETFGVAKAKHLHESIGIIQPPAGTRFFMVKVDEVPPFKGKVNQDAIDALNSIAH